MTENFLEKLFEHNNWANQKIIQACSTLSDGQLDAPPQSATEGSIRSTLLHLVSAQYGYLRLLTLRRSVYMAGKFKEIARAVDIGRISQ